LHLGSIGGLPVEDGVGDLLYRLLKVIAIAAGAVVDVDKACDGQAHVCHEASVRVLLFALGGEDQAESPDFLFEDGDPDVAS